MWFSSPAFRVRLFTDKQQSTTVDCSTLFTSKNVIFEICINKLSDKTRVLCYFLCSLVFKILTVLKVSTEDIKIKIYSKTKQTKKQFNIIPKKSKIQNWRKNFFQMFSDF